MKMHFKTTREKRLRIPSRTSLRRYEVYRSRLFTPAANNKLQYSSINISGMHLSRRVSLFLQTLRIYIYIIYIYFFFQSHQSPSGPVYTEKAQKLFGFTRLFDLNMKIHFKTARGKRLHIPSRTNLRRYIVYHSRLATLAANNKLQNSPAKTNFDRQVDPS